MVIFEYFYVNGFLGMDITTDMAWKLQTGNLTFFFDNVFVSVGLLPLNY